MGKIKSAVFDAGPFIHLKEINKLNLTELFKEILTTQEILKECRRILKEIKKLKIINCKKLTAKSKDIAKYFIEKYKIDLGESTGIALSIQERINLFFTDDLEARFASQELGLEVHGTIAVILRAYREKLLNKKEVNKTIEDLHKNSTLFFTSDLKEWALKEIADYKRN